MKLSLVVSGLIGLTAAACARAPAPGARVARTTSAETSSDGTPAPGRVTTLAAAISGPSEENDSKADEPSPLPTACAAEGSIKDTKVCMPERAYAKRLCAGIYPEVALSLLAKGTPFTRAYLAGDVEAWNASGGRTHRAKLAFDEEVIVVAKNGAAPTGGIVMTGAQASYDALRWDGTCVSIMEGELTTKRPPAPKPAEVSFSRLEEATRHALLETPKVKASHAALAKACFISAIATTTNKSACEKADQAFSSAIVDAVRGGATLPSPARRP